MRYDERHDEKKKRVLETLKDIKALLEKRGYRMRGFIKIQEPDGKCWRMYAEPPAPCSGMSVDKEE